MTGRALLIVPDHAYKPNTGGGQRSALFFEALSSAYEVDLLIIAEFVPPGYFEDLYGAKNFRQEDYAPAGMRGFWRYIRPIIEISLIVYPPPSQRASKSIKPMKSTAETMQNTMLSLLDI